MEERSWSCARGERAFDKYEVRGVAGQGGAAIVYEVEPWFRLTRMLPWPPAQISGTEPAIP